jgi:hypothetical protein
MSEICAGKVERVIGCAGWVVKELDGLVSREASEREAQLMRRQRSAQVLVQLHGRAGICRLFTTSKLASLDFITTVIRINQRYNNGNNVCFPFPYSMCKTSPPFPLTHSQPLLPSLLLLMIEI